MSESLSKHVVVVGGGVTGLTAAYRIHKLRPEWRVTLLESRDRLGGNIVTVREKGFVIDGGPDSFVRTKPAAVKLARELGLEDQLITTKPDGRKVYLAHAGQLEAMPEGMALGVPTRPGPLVRSRLLGWPAKLRLFSEPFWPAGNDDGRDESIYDFLSRRLGGTAAERLAGPLLGGIYAGDIRKLSMRATFPQLIELEKKHRSLVLGTLAMRADGRRRVKGEATPNSRLKRTQQLIQAAWGTAESPFYSFKGGMLSLIDALADALPQGTVRLEAGLDGLRREGEKWQLVSGDQKLEADAVVLACPARVAAKLVPTEQLSRDLSSIQYLSTATVFFAFDRSQVSHPLDGVGFVVPPGEGDILAGTFINSKWEHRVPEGKVLLRAFLGGARGGELVEQQSDAELSARALKELKRLMGRLGEPEWTRVFRYPKSNPQPHLGHKERLVRLRENGVRGLELAGAAYDGVGIPDCVAQAERAAESIIKQLA
ncbi:MAG: protoporphyrinogen oxidase [Polyangiaceae bacterium]|nr:protoporphyrinogen oxidase [Myxococcales bacterium]MCB9590600.1 protoporphyrinogen oxidase [Polyangiaceae bacterium]